MTDYFSTILPPQVEKSQDTIDPPKSCIWPAPLSESSATEGSTAIGVRTPSEQDILSPRAIPANVANHSDPWRDASETESHDNGISSLRDVRPKRSIADKLGYLVERGWVGMDVFGKAYNDRHASDDITSKPHIHQQKMKRRSQSSGDEARSVNLLLRKRSHSYSASRTPTSYHSSPTLPTSEREDEEPTPLALPTSRKMSQVRDGEVIPTRGGILRSDSDSAYSPNDTALSKTRQVFSLRSPRRLRGSQSQHFELDTMSRSRTLELQREQQDRRAINHFMSSGNTPPMPKQGPIVDLSEKPGQISESPLIAPSLRRASTNTTTSTRSAGRSTSWFGKYRFMPKLVPADKPPLLWEFATNESGRVKAVEAESETSQYVVAHADQQSQDASKSHGPTVHGHGDNKKTKTSSGDLRMRKELRRSIHVYSVSQDASSDSKPAWDVVPPQDSDKQQKWEQFQLRAKISQAFGLQERDSEGSIASREPKIVELFSEQTLNPLPEHSPPRSKRPSKSISTNPDFDTAGPPERHAEEITQPSSTGPQTFMPTASPRLHFNDSPKPVSSGSGTETPRPKTPIETPQRRGSETIEFPLEQPVDASAANTPEISESPRTVRRESKASNKGIKKIQVTITFDGAAEDLSIEAKLQRKGDLGD